MNLGWKTEMPCRISNTEGMKQHDGVSNGDALLSCLHNGDEKTTGMFHRYFQRQPFQI